MQTSKEAILKAEQLLRAEDDYGFCVMALSAAWTRTEISHYAMG